MYSSFSQIKHLSDRNFLTLEIEIERIFSINLTCFIIKFNNTFI